MEEQGDVLQNEEEKPVENVEDKPTEEVKTEENVQEIQNAEVKPEEGQAVAEGEAIKAVNPEIAENVEKADTEVAPEVKEESIVEEEEDESDEESSFSEAETIDSEIAEIDPESWRKPTEEEEAPYVYPAVGYVIEDDGMTELQRHKEYLKERALARPPVFLTKLTDRAGPKGSDIKLNCTIDGLEVMVRWYKNDQPIERTEYCQTLQNDGLYTLILKKANRHDNGVYRVDAKNRSEIISSEATVTVYDKYDEKPTLPYMVKIRDYYHIPLNDLIIECQIMGTPVPTVRWLKDNEEVKLDNRIRATYEGDEIFQLNIYNPVTEDSGRYSCIAENSAGKNRMSHVVNFVAKVLPIHLPGMHHADKKVLNEEEAEAYAIQQAAEEAEKIAARERRPDLTVPHATAEDNAETFLIRDSKVKVGWDGQLHNITANVGSKVKFICSANGPQPILKWQKDGKAIEWSDRVKMHNEGNVGQIIISKAVKKDAGEYSCTAQGVMNSVTTTAVLKVIELPKERSTKPTFARAIKGEEI